MNKFIESLMTFFMVWGVLLVLNQLFIFGGCFAPHCLLAALPHTGVISFLIISFMSTDKLEEKTLESMFTDKFQEKSIDFTRKPDEANDALSSNPLKAKGDEYERYIGKHFEDKGDLVIYNGFIRGFEDGGVDLVAISPDGKTLNLIQCKNWNYRTIEVEHIQRIYQKLVNHNFDFLNLPIEQIKTHLHTHKDEKTIREIIAQARQNKNNFTIRKTLYIASEKVVNLEIGKHLTMIQPNIFRYQDMKIVVERI